MTTSIKKLNQTLVFIPFVGMFLFVCFYFIASIQYTGGSYVSPDHTNFSLKNNYLCDLLDTYQFDGTLNAARISALMALMLLCFSIISFWNLFPKLFLEKSKLQIVMQITGILSMVILFFLAVGDHDIIIRIAGVFGTIAHSIALLELYKADYFKIFIFGLFCLILFLVNYYLYETGLLLNLLPIIQKITFVACLSWFTILNSILYKQMKLRHYF
nr:hypothetical protein [uncultured Psychroserpens sp.]